MLRWDRDDHTQHVHQSCRCSTSTISCRYLFILALQKRCVGTVSPNPYSLDSKVWSGVTDYVNKNWEASWNQPNDLDGMSKYVRHHEYESPVTFEMRGKLLEHLILRCRQVYRLFPNEYFCLPYLLDGMKYLWERFSLPQPWSKSDANWMEEKMSHFTSPFSTAEHTPYSDQIQPLSMEEESSLRQSIAEAWKNRPTFPTPDLWCQWLDRPLWEATQYEKNNTLVRSEQKALQAVADARLRIHQDECPPLIRLGETFGHTAHSIRATFKIPSTRKSRFVDRAFAQLSADMILQLKKEGVQPWIKDPASSRWLYGVYYTVDAVDPNQVELCEEMEINLMGTFYL